MPKYGFFLVLYWKLWVRDNPYSGMFMQCHKVKYYLIKCGVSLGVSSASLRTLYYFYTASIPFVVLILKVTFVLSHHFINNYI